MMKLLVSDFDRTLYVDQTISQDNLIAVKAWQLAGNLFAIATGRNKDSLLKNLEKFSITPNYFICNNGGIIYDKDLKPLYYHCIDEKATVNIVHDLCQNYDHAVGISSLTHNVKVLGKIGIDDRKGSDEVVSLAQLTKIQSILQVSVKFNTIEQTQEVCAYLNKTHAASISAYSNVNNLDIVAREVNKATAVQFILDRQNELKTAITVGDSYNDIEMIKRYNGYTLSNAKEEIQRIATHVCTDVSSIINEQ